MDREWFQCDLRVRYPEVDRQGVVHHASYLIYFEVGRTELLRARGLPYRRLEDDGVRLVVVESQLRHRLPARYDEVLQVRTRVASVSKVRLRLEYQVLRQQALGQGEPEILCEGSTVLASVDAAGKPRALPEALRAIGPAGEPPVAPPRGSSR